VRTAAGAGPCTPVYTGSSVDNLTPEYGDSSANRNKTDLRTKRPSVYDSSP
jgi:hypothetical protein